MSKVFNGLLFLFGILHKKIRIYYFSYSIISIFHILLFAWLPFLYKGILDKIVNGNAFSEDVIFYFVLTITAFASIKLWSTFNIFLKNKSIEVISNLFFIKILKIKDDIFFKENSSRWTHVFNNDIKNISMIFLDFVFTIPAEIIYAVVLFAIVGFNSRILLFLLIANYIVNGICILIRDKYMVNKYETAQNKYKKLQENTNTYLNGLQELILNQSCDFFGKKLDHWYSEYIHTQKNILKNDFILNMLSKITDIIVQISVVAVCLSLFIEGRISFGMVVILIQFSIQLCSKLSEIVENMSFLQYFIPHLDSLKKVYDYEERPDSCINTIESFKSIRFEDVYINYGDRTILKNVNLSIHNGDRVLISGKSGIGKTSLIRSIQNQNLINSGFIDFRDRKPEIAYLSQNPYLFNRSIRENLLMANQNSSEKELNDVLCFVELDKLVKDASYGLDRMAGVDGCNLSGGEKARLAFARILLIDKEFYILDEPLIGVDHDLKKNIIEKTAKFFQNKTLLLISHDENFKETCNKKFIIGYNNVIVNEGKKYEQI